MRALRVSLGAVFLILASMMALAIEPATETFVVGKTYNASGWIKPTFSAITVQNGASEVARITYEGRVFLNGREVHTDAQYREAIMAIVKGSGCRQ